jgi:hypothetical protein
MLAGGRDFYPIVVIEVENHAALWEVALRAEGHGRALLRGPQRGAGAGRAGLIELRFDG